MVNELNIYLWNSNYFWRYYYRRAGISIAPHQHDQPQPPGDLQSPEWRLRIVHLRRLFSRREGYLDRIPAGGESQESEHQFLQISRNCHVARSSQQTSRSEPVRGQCHHRVGAEQQDRIIEFDWVKIIINSFFNLNIWVMCFPKMGIVKKKELKLGDGTT